MSDPKKVLITIDGETGMTRDQLGLVIADEFDEHNYVHADSVTIQLDGEPSMTYLLDGGDDD